MDTSPATPLSARLGNLMIALMQQVGRIFLRDRSALPSVLLAQGRLRSFSMRLQSLLRRIEQGTVPAYRPGRPTGKHRPRAEVAPDAIRLPTVFGWLVRDNGPEGWHIRSAAGQIGTALNEASMLEVLARAPRQAGRIVRPLCHAIGLEVPELLRAPPRAKRAKKARAVKPPKPKSPPRPDFSAKWRRVASAQWPRNVVGPGETVPLRSGRRRH